MVSRAAPGLGLNTEWDLAEDGWKPGMDANLNTLSAIVQLNVKGRVSALPTTGMVKGDAYIRTGSTGTNNIVIWDDAATPSPGQWITYVPQDGWLAYDTATEDLLAFDAGLATWMVVGGNTAVPYFRAAETKDFNTIVEVGWYPNLVRGANSPNGNTSTYYFVLTLRYSTGYYCQMAYPYSARSGGPNETERPCAVRWKHGDSASWITWEQFSYAGDSAQPGDVKMTAVNLQQRGWLKANGAAISRTTYAALFAAIGTTFGAGDGSTTFNLPDYRGEFLRGLDEGRGVDPNRTIASAQGSQNLAHNHDITVASAAAHTHTGTTSSDSHNHTGTTSSAGAHSHRTGGLTSSSDDIGRFGGRSGMQDLFTSTDGAHTHSFTTSTDSHTHTFTTASGGGHTHTASSANDGGTEARPRNKAVIYWIKY